MPNRQCAACNSPVRSLSRTLAHEASLVTSTLRPYCLYRPSLSAMTTEAQSVSGIKPMRMRSPAPATLVALGEAGVAFAPQLANHGVAAAAKDNLRNARRFMVLASSSLSDAS